MGEIYERVADFVADVGDALRRQGAPARDLIDAQSFLYLRDPAVIGADPLAESVATFREDYPYNEEEKAEKAMAKLEDELADPEKWSTPEKAAKATSRHDKAKNDLADLYRQWEEAEAAVN